MVALPARTWRPYAGPIAFLLVATVAIGLVRVAVVHDHHHTTAPPKAHQAAAAPKQKHYYAVHAGDTLGSIAAKTHVSLAALRRLNPNVEPTALFLGERIHVP